MAEYAKLELDYSEKNIPICRQNDYRLKLIDKTRNLIRRLRLKAYFFNEEETEQNERNIKENYGFKSNFNPPKNKYLEKFEEDLITIVDNIQFRKIKSNFQNKLRKDIKTIKQSNKVIVAADKTTNYYKLDKNQYTKLLLDNITKN